MMSIVITARSMKPDLRVAMLGAPDDGRRCERWMRRGCAVYLAASSGVSRVLAALRLASDHHVLVIDQAFQDLATAFHPGLLPTLTHREEEVLGLLYHGLRNVDIAVELHVSENTVEFHVRQLLSKLGARNRLEAVERAITLGLY